nr:MAG TPA: hypothetical protein [Caudoviricetes sp.]
MCIPAGDAIADASVTASAWRRKSVRIWQICC